jgi:hypothetical protein
MRSLLVWSLAVVLAVAVGSFVAAPYVAFMALRSAADAQDVQGLNQIVDFDAVRASLKTGLTPGPAQPAARPSIWKDPLGAIKSAITPITQPTPDADPYLTPKALAALTRGEGRDSSRPQPYVSNPPPKPWPSVNYWGVNRCRLSVHADGHGDTIFTFERRGPFSWKLVQIGLPTK